MGAVRPERRGACAVEEDVTRYLALACDYDGTLTTSATLAAETTDALERLRASGRRAVAVTGRRLDDLRAVCPRLDLFDCIVAENGAVLHWPDSRDTVVLSRPPPDEFTDALRRRGVTPLDRDRPVAELVPIGRVGSAGSPEAKGFTVS